MVKCSVICPPLSPPLPHTVYLKCVCVCVCVYVRERERKRDRPYRLKTGRGREERREVADRRKIVTVFLPPAGNELVKGKSE